MSNGKVREKYVDGRKQASIMPSFDKWTAMQKPKSEFRTKDPAVLKKRREAILPYLEFGTGVQAWGERGEDPNLSDLLWTLPAVAGAGVGALKAGKDVYSRATTTPVWRGIRTKLKKNLKGDRVVGSPLYDDVLHTTLNPAMGTDYAIDEALRFGGAEGGRLLKFRVPKKYFKEKGIIGPFQEQAEEIVFKEGLPKSWLEYSKKPKNLNPLEKLENYLYSFKRNFNYDKVKVGDVALSNKLEKYNKLVSDKRMAQADKLEKGGMKRAYRDEADWYNRNSQLRFTNPQGMKKIFKLIKKQRKQGYLTGLELKELRNSGWKWEDPILKKVQKKPVKGLWEFKAEPKVVMGGVRPGKPLYKKRIKSKKFDGIISAEGNVVEAQDAFERQMNYMNRPGYSGGRRIRDKRGDFIKLSPEEKKLQKIQENIFKKSQN